MAGKTLYISDLDGTLLNSSAELTEYTARALGAMIAGGLNFSVATARTLASAGKILAGVELRAPIVLMNGALIYDAARERYVKIYRLPPETVAAAVRTLKAFAITGFMYELRDGELATYYESLEKKPLRDFVEERVARYGKPFLHAASFAGVPAEHIVYFALLDTQERLRPVRDALAALPGLNLAFYRDIYSSDMWYLEMFSARASKREAVAYLREALGYGRVVGFGDNLNDLPMFAACDEKVAVENAKPEVRAAADHICGANDSDGVARWLEQNARYIPCRSGRKEQEMSENTETPNTNSAVNYFQTGDKLASTVSKMTSGAGGKFQRRDFVSPLIDFCTDNCYNGKLGIVYGLRSTGKTVGMLQAAETLAERGYRAAYARFNYEETGMAAVTEEIKALSESGVTHFFVDEASYLSGFINLAPDWSDWLVPERGIKIIISGTDSFMLWTAQRTSLFHRYAQFSTNWNSFPEYRRVTGKPYDEYNREGGIFAVGEMPAFIQSAVVDNLLHTIAHCVDDANRTSSYTDSLYGIGAAVIYKAVISILKCAVETSVKEHFSEKAGERNVSDLGAAVSGLSLKDRRELKERVADSLSVYKDFAAIKDPFDVIEALIEFLVKIGCLADCSTAMSDIGRARKTYTFNHNALMSYAVEETVQGILSIEDINRPEFAAGVRQAAAGAINESVVLSHIFNGAGKGDKVFKYRDLEGREVDVVVVNREAKNLRLIEVKSKGEINVKNVFSDEARHLYSAPVLQNIGVDGTFSITRTVAYMGKSAVIPRREGPLLLVNIEQLLDHYQVLGHFLDQLNELAAQT